MRHKQADRLWGVALGFGAPLGCVLFRMILVGRVAPSWIGAELSGHSFFYVYMTLLTPLVFGFFGAYLGLLHDRISDQKRSLEAFMGVLKNQSMTDDVTGLYNHRHILEEIEKEIERSKRQRRGICGMMVDVDNFKEVNDIHGHLIGDYVLREIAFVLNESIRKIDIIGRYGGDEFIVVLPETTFEPAKVVAERLQKSVQSHRFKTKTDYVSLTVSVGLWYFEDLTDLTTSEFVEKVDEAMFKAKQLGKDRVYCL